MEKPGQLKDAEIHQHSWPKPSLNPRLKMSTKKILNRDFMRIKDRAMDGLVLPCLMGKVW